MVKPQTISTLRLDKINAGGGTQARVDVDPVVVADYAELMADGHKFPPLAVVFDGKDYWLVDGFHRWWAAKKAELKSLKCTVVSGSREDARWLSCAANRDHGLHRNNADKRRAVQTALRHPNGVKMSDRKIADHVGVSAPMVSKYREELATTEKDLQSTARVGRDGRTTNTANIGRAIRSNYQKLARDFGTYEDSAEPQQRLPVGIRCANEAINCLKKIPQNDADRERGFEIVSDWIENNE